MGKKQFYEWAFVAVVGVSFLAWLFGIFSDELASRQFDVFFRRCQDFLADTLNVVGYSSQRDVYHNTMYSGLGEKAYPPLTYVFAYLLSRVVDMEMYWQIRDFRMMYMQPQFMCIFLILFAIMIVMVYELLRSCKNGTKLIKVSTAAVVMASAPMLYSYERANTIILTMFFVMLFLFYYDSEKRWLREVALISLAIAAALKMTPAVLGILLLYKKQWKEAVRTVIYGLLIFVLPFFFFEGGLSNIPQMFSNMKMNLEAYASTDGCTIIASVFHFNGGSLEEWMQRMLEIVTWIVGIGLLGMTPFFEKRWEQLMAVSMALIILPSHSGYYCILYLIPAIIAYLNEETHRMTDLIVLVSIFFIMCPLQSDIGINYLNYHLSILLLCGFLLIRGGIVTGHWFLNRLTTRRN